MDSESQLPLLGGENRRFLILTTAKKIILTSFVLTACVAIAVFVSAAKPFPVSRFSEPPPKKLKNPVVIMISTDGFAFSYKSNESYKFPNIQKLTDSGTEAKEGLVSVFPTQTFPNHYSIATGLYPADHGIVNNDFPDPDNLNGAGFDQPSKDPKWWLGEPLWVSVSKYTKRNLGAMTYFWPGSEVEKKPWTCVSNENCKNFDAKNKVAFRQQIEDVLAYFDSCSEVCNEDIPVLFDVYFDQPDLAGHRFGPASDEVRDNIAIVDDAIGLLVEGLTEKEVFKEVNIILLSDHGMVNRNDYDRGILLQDILDQTDLKDKKLPEGWLFVDKFLPHLGVQTPKGTSSDLIDEVVSQMNRGLSKVTNGEHLTVFRKENLPKELHYSSGDASDRIPAIFGIADLEYVVIDKRKYRGGGTHGYDNKYKEMRGIFIGHGPRFEKGRKVPSFDNIQIYNLVTEILGIQGAENRGDMSFKDSVLLPAEAVF